MLIRELRKSDKMAKMYFRFGAMNCGKTTALLQVAHNYEEQGMNVIVIKSSVDKFLAPYLTNLSRGRSSVGNSFINILFIIC